MRVSLLNQTHPDYDHDHIERWEALFEGGAEWHEMVNVFQPKNPEEPEEVYRVRRHFCRYVNHCGPIIHQICGWLFGDVPVVEGVDPAWIKDVDRAGTAFGPWWQALLTSAMVGRRAYAWVNLPAVDLPDGASLADQDNLGGRRVYLVPLEAEEVVNWRRGEDGNLTEIMIRRRCQDQTSLLEAQSTVWRWIHISPSHVTRWEWRPPSAEPTRTPNGTDEATETSQIAHGFGRLPVVAIDLPAGLHTMGALEDAAVALTVDTNALRWGLYRNMHAILGLFSDSDPRPPNTGAGAFFRAGANDRAEYIETSGNGFAAMEARTKSDREDLYRVVSQMAQSASADSTKASTSGSSKAMDYKSLEILLRSYADVVLGAMRQALTIAAEVWKLDPKGVTVTGLGSWGAEDIGEKLAQIALASSDVKSETFRKEVAKRIAEALLDDADEALMKVIKAEIDAADYSDPTIIPGPAPVVPDPTAGEGA